MLFNERFEKMGINYDTLPIFESHFESGNLQLAYIIKDLEDKENKENNNNNSYINNASDITCLNNSLNIDNDNIDRYELFLHNDTNTLGYTQWFFF